MKKTWTKLFAGWSENQHPICKKNLQEDLADSGVVVHRSTVLGQTRPSWKSQLKTISASSSLNSNSTKYQKIMETNILACVKKLKRGWLLQEDNDPKNTFMSTMEYVTKRMLKVFLNALWQSVDLNITENQWVGLKRDVHERLTKNTFWKDGRKPGCKNYWETVIFVRVLLSTDHKGVPKLLHMPQCFLFLFIMTRKVTMHKSFLEILCLCSTS